MPLDKPTDDDVRKIHMEVNQILNQRFLLTTTAITIFGVIGAWLIPKNQPLPQTPIEGFIYSISTLLTLILLILFWYSNILRKMLRVLTTYLEVVAQSKWENHWKLFRADNKHFAYSKAQAGVFLCLGILSTSYPILLKVIFSLTFEASCSFWINTLTGVLYLVIVGIIGFTNGFDNETKVSERWNKLSSKQ